MARILSQSGREKVYSELMDFFFTTNNVIHNDKLSGYVLGMYTEIHVSYECIRQLHMFLYMQVCISLTLSFFLFVLLFYSQLF